MINVPAGALTCWVEAAHIIPFSLGAWRNDGEQRRKAAIWVNLYRYFPGIRSRLNFFMENLNDPLSVMILETSIRMAFSEFKLALEETIEPNNCRIKTFPGFPELYSLFLPSDRTVTFSSHDSRFQLPHRDLLSLHAAVANILHASGRAEVIDKVGRTTLKSIHI